MSFIVKVLLSSFSVIVATWLLNGVMIRSYITALLVVFVMAILNMILKPILVILTIPVTIFTFGLFLLVINAVIALIASSIVPGFYIDGFWTALWFSLIISILNYLINLDDRNKRRSYR
ncbi:MAG: phage holin family protein [Bacteroidales bacterium]|nr:phage holin family protein [Bacteroidales bacterium]